MGFLSEVAKLRLDDGPELTLVHIPNLTHSISLDSWTKLLPQLASSNARVLQYQHNICIQDPFVWELLSDSGFTLLDCLFNDYCHKKDYNGTLILVSEGLGGLILKHALVAAGGQSKRYRGLLDSVLGLILIGVPHVKDTSEDTVQRVANLLRPALKTVPKKSLRKEDLYRLGLLSDKFREVSLPLPEGLISGYETEQTALAGGYLKLNKTFAILVDKRFAAIDWPGDKEQLLPLNVQLEAVLCPDRPCMFRSQLKLYISKVTGAASSFLSGIRESFDANPPPLRQQSSQRTTVSSPENNPSTPQLGVGGPGQTSSPLLQDRSAYSPSLVTLPHRWSPSTVKPPSLGTMSSVLSSSGGSDSSFEIIPEAASFNSAQRPLKLPRYLLKPHSRNKRFWPRDGILQRIEHALLPRPTTPNTSGDIDNLASMDGDMRSLRTYVLHGIGGVGKTELAIEFVFRHKDKFDAVFIVHADVSSTLSSDFIRIADELGLDHNGDPENAKETLKDWLANPVKTLQTRGSTDARALIPDLANWLIVFDNADKPEILRDFYPEDGHGSILVTSRDPEVNDEDYFGEAGEEVTALSTDESAEILRSLTRSGNSPDTEESSKVIAKRLDGLPLAIEQISAFIRKNRLTLSQFEKVYRNDEDFEALQSNRIAPRRGYEHSIAGVWALQDLPRGSLALLNIMSFLDPDRMHQEFFKRTLSCVSISPYPKSELQYFDARTGLLERSLVSQSSDQEDFRVHRLVQDVARARMRQSKALEAYFDAAVNMVWTEFPRITRGGVGRAHKVNRWDKCAELFPHIQRLRGFFISFDDKNRRITTRAQFADLLNEAGWYQFEKTNASEANPVLDLAYTICKESEDDRTEQLALVLGSKTWISILTKDFEACHNCAQQRLECEEKLFASSQLVTANLAAAYNDLGVAYSLNGLPSKAFPLLFKSKGLRESMPGFKKMHNFSPLHDLSLAYMQQEEYDKASKCLLEALEDREAALGRNDFESVRTGQLFYALGNVRARQGRLDESFAWHQKALVHYRATGGDSHYKTGIACFRVAEHHVRYRQYGLARSLLDQALRIFQDRHYYQQEHSRTCFLYAQLLANEGKPIEARQMLERSVAAFNTAFPRMHRTTADLTADDFNALCTYDF